MFENYQFHGLYIAIQAVLTLYAQGMCWPESSDVAYTKLFLVNIDIHSVPV